MACGCVAVKPRIRDNPSPHLACSGSPRVAQDEYPRIAMGAFADMSMLQVQIGCRSISRPSEAQMNGFTATRASAGVKHSSLLRDHSDARTL